MHLLKAPEIHQTQSARLAGNKKDFTDRQLPVYLLGDTRSGSDTTCSCSFQTVDQTTLSHVWKAFKTGVAKRFCFRQPRLNTARIRHAAERSAYLQRLRWWPSLCLGCGSSCRVASSGNLHQHKHWCWEALWWPVSLVRYCVSVHGTRRKEKCEMMWFCM